MRVALVNPPLTQLNTPYPGTAYLARFLRDEGIATTQWDLGIDLVLRVFSRPGLAAIFDAIADAAETGQPLPGAPDGLPEPAWEALALRHQHERCIDAVIAFLQERDRTLAGRIVAGNLLPPTPRLQRADLDRFGPAGVEDSARHLATRYIADLADLVASTVDPGFRLASYQHHLAVGPVAFDPVAARLDGDDGATLLDQWLDQLVDERLDAHPDVGLVGLSVPFPGTLYGALRIGQRVRARGIPVVMGGGYVNTELREVDEPRLWECVDALTYDDGESPLRAIIDHLDGGPDRRHRTRTREGLHQAPSLRPKVVPVAWYGDLPLDRYLQLVDATNVAQRLWGDGRWNKATLAHGCYWRRCAFCDIQLDYIARFEPARIDALVDAMQEVVEETGQTGFHFVDEAAPPRLLKELALTLLERELQVSWWGNIRFEPSFTPDLCRLLAASGLVMVTGGLEVASDRLLALMDKGITVEQAARTAHAFRQAGVRVHAYLMYGFPTQSDQETVDSMEVVRQLFEAGALDSAFWHRFVLTRHSGVYKQPERYDVVVPDMQAPVFAMNDLPHQDPRGGAHDRFDHPLVEALGEWMRGSGLNKPVHTWLPSDLPAPTDDPRRIRNALEQITLPRGEHLVWLGGDVLELGRGLVLFGTNGPVELHGRRNQLEWLAEVIEAARPGSERLRWRDAYAAFPGEDGTLGRIMDRAAQAGLVQV